MRKFAAAALAATALLAGATTAQARTMYVSSTAYCLQGRTANGGHGYIGSVAFDYARLGTRIHVSRSPSGLRWHRVNDRTDGRTGLDFWTSSCWLARAWGRRSVKVTF